MALTQCYRLFVKFSHPAGDPSCEIVSFCIFELYKLCSRTIFHFLLLISLLSADEETAWYSLGSQWNIHHVLYSARQVKPLQLIFGERCLQINICNFELCCSSHLKTTDSQGKNVQNASLHFLFSNQL